MAIPPDKIDAPFGSFGTVSPHTRVRRANDSMGYMRAWFDANFEAPDIRLKRHEETGTYIYRYGGPFKAEDVLNEHFTGQIDQYGDLYVPRLTTAVVGQILYPDNLDDWSPKPNSEYYRKFHTKIEIDKTHQEQIDSILEQIDEIRKNLTTVETDKSLLGHNHPPENIGLPPYHDEDRDDILKLLDRAENEVSATKLQPEVILETGKAIVDKSRPFIEYAKTTAKFAATAVAGEALKKGFDWLTIGSNRIHLMHSLHQLGTWMVHFVSSLMS